MAIVDFAPVIRTVREVRGLGEYDIDVISLVEDILSYHVSQYFLERKGIITRDFNQIRSSSGLSEEVFNQVDDIVVGSVIDKLNLYGRGYKNEVRLKSFELQIPYIECGGVPDEVKAACDKVYRFSIMPIADHLSKYFNGDIRFKDHNAFVDMAFTYLEYEFSMRFAGLQTIKEHPLSTYFSREEALTMLLIYRRATPSEMRDHEDQTDSGLLGVLFDDLDVAISEWMDKIMDQYELKSSDIIYLYKPTNQSLGIMVDRKNLESVVYNMVVDFSNGCIKTNLKNKSIYFCRSYL